MAIKTARRIKPASGPQQWATQFLSAGLLVLLLTWGLGRWRGVPLNSGWPGALINLGWLLLVCAGLLRLLAGRNAKQVQPGPREGPSTLSSGNSRLSTLPPASRPPEVSPSMWNASVFEVIEWRRFEIVVEALFVQAGFITHAKSHGDQGGVDIWLHSHLLPGETVGVVRCLHWRGKKVNAEMVRDFLRNLAELKVKRGHFATASVFTPDAAEFARGNQVSVLDVNGLLALIEQRSADEQKELLKTALDGDYWRPSCARCGIKLVDRVEPMDGKPYWGCPNNPVCKTTMAKRRHRKPRP